MPVSFITWSIRNPNRLHIKGSTEEVQILPHAHIVADQTCPAYNRQAVSICRESLRQSTPEIDARPEVGLMRPYKGCAWSSLPDYSDRSGRGSDRHSESTNKISFSAVNESEAFCQILQTKHRRLAAIVVDNIIEHSLFLDRLVGCDTG